MIQRFFNALFRLIMTTALLTVSVTLALALVHLPVNWRENGTVLPLVAGFFGGLAFFFLISRFLALYVFGHELTHFLVAKLFRRQTGRFRIGVASGSVAVERPNIWITLAPYFIPLYTLIWIGIYGLADFFWATAPAWLPEAFAAGIGITYAFHVRLTLYALARQQSDLERYGRPLSLAFISCCNVLLLFLGVLTATGEWGQGARTIQRTAVREWRIACRGADTAWAGIKRGKTIFDQLIGGES
jgi:hypothetical protein